MENIYRLPIPLEGSPLKELNVYLIKGMDRNLLIDTGYRTDSCRKALFGQLEELGLHPVDVEVLLTHMHADHSGLADEAAGKGGIIYIGRRDRFVFAPETDWQAYRARSDARFAAEGFPEELIQTLPFTNPSRAAAPPRDLTHICLDDGDVLEAGGYQLRCLLMPGHTPGHLCFWLENEQTMFLGDHVLFDISPNITC